MNSLNNQKVRISHLSRNACLYIRKYSLKQRAISVGWPLENITTIDSDLSQSGVASTERTGFQRLVTEMSMGNAGIIIGIEVSRLSRSSAG